MNTSKWTAAPARSMKCFAMIALGVTLLAGSVFGAELPAEPLKGKLQVGYADAIFNRSKGGITPSGWSCDHLPYLVEFDNFGGRNQGQSTANTIFCWGYDEITSFSVLPEADRNAWLHYAWNWIAQNDPNGHLEMPGSRVITPGANARSDACPMGSNTEQTIKEIFAENFAEK